MAGWVYRFVVSEYCLGMQDWTGMYCDIKINMAAVFFMLHAVHVQ